jgi:hypothetical protein
MAAERAVKWQAAAQREAAATPQFGQIKRPTLILRVYEEKREQLTPRDAGAAFFALGRLLRNSAYRIRADPLADHPRATALRKDVAASAPLLPSRELSNALLGAAYMRSADEGLLSALCEAASDKAAELFSLRDVATCIYALGRLGRADEALLPPLLTRVVREAPRLHAIEMALAANGLADLQVAQPEALHALSRAAIAKLEQFGAAELPRLLSALSSLGWHDEQLLRLSAARLPLLLTDMEPKALSSMAAAFAAADLWIPVVLQALADEAARKAHAFSARHAAITLASLGRLRWEHQSARDALFGRIAAAASNNEATLSDIAVAVRALSRVTSIGDPDPSEHAPVVQVPTLLRAAGMLLDLDTVAHGNEAGHLDEFDEDSDALEEARLRDLAAICNGALLLRVSPPEQLVRHANEALEQWPARSSGDSDSSRRRRALRRVRAKLDDALRHWTGTGFVLS